MRGWIGSAVVLAALGTAAGAAAQQRPEVLETRVGDRELTLRVAHHRAYAAINATELSPAVFQSGQIEGATLRARVAGRDLSMEAGSPFFLFGDDAYQLANAPYQWGGAFWIPSEFVTSWMPRVLDGAGPLIAAGVPDGPTPRRIDPSQTWHVVIDPGHGGRDPGTLGRESREKDVVLAIGLALRDELADAERIEVSMTRSADVYVKHDDRSALAVEREGDLFVSIHANAASARSARGFETIFLGPARSEEARSVALRENRTPEVDGEGSGSINDLMFILTGLDRTENLSESRRFAGFVQNELRRARGRASPDRGVKQGPWWVLLGALARMPSVIVEVGFLSNADEEAYLRTTEGQREVARAIADAVVAYRADVLSRFSRAAEGDR